MKSNIEEAHQALLEGNRAEVLRLLQDLPDTDEIIWLKAQAVPSEVERNQALVRLTEKHDPKISVLSGQILERENQFAKDLSEPPDYKFWKQPTWNDRLSKMQQYRIWLLGGLLLIVLTGVGISLNLQAQTQQDQTIATIKATQTAAAFYSQTVSTYPAGTLRILQIEYPTSRSVTFGEMNDNDFLLATPAAGARFAAVNFQFVCSLALCTNPPEADLNLLMADGHVVSYGTGSRPFLIGQPPMSRIAQGQSTDGWFVFEIPQNSTPDAVLVITGDNEKPQIINWTNP